MFSEQVREEVEGEEEEEEGEEDTAMLGYWSNPEAEVSLTYWKLGLSHSLIQEQTSILYHHTIITLSLTYSV